jgi:serine/threonine protein kinase
MLRCHLGRVHYARHNLARSIMTTGNQLPPTFIDFELGRACPSEDLSLTKGDKYGYFPAALNQVLHRRYTIIRKLGWGTAASVWLAEDTQFVFPHLIQWEYVHVSHKQA